MLPTKVGWSQRSWTVGTSSLRTDRLTDEIVGLLRRGGYRTLATASDGPSERLRTAIRGGARRRSLRGLVGSPGHDHPRAHEPRPVAAHVVSRRQARAHATGQLAGSVKDGVLIDRRPAGGVPSRSVRGSPGRSSLCLAKTQALPLPRAAASVRRRLGSSHSLGGEISVTEVPGVESFTTLSVVYEWGS
jgi:hypothetical protein